ncbi:hypothetical protein [Krasilnikovia sp. MM14-A1259]|uniref:hypothetical protein n=1 Tax=Krasilnikovia sp. MM14-A1259 TaxID=3373539 RepID=UPI0037F956B2
MDSVEIRPDPVSFERVARALSAEAPSGHWRRDLSEGMSAALAPGVAAVRAALMARGGGHGHGHEGSPLRPAIAAGVHVLPLGSGAVIVAEKTPRVRGFANAPKRFNQRGFRRRAYGRGAWVVQVGAPGWFDDTLKHMHPRLHAAALAALEGRARRISRRA